jgi:DNA mismatch endonuclease, patch repair protein
VTVKAKGVKQISATLMKRGAVPVGRSENMRRIRSKDTKPELLLRRALFAAGFRYRIHDESLPGKPDVVFRGRSVAVLIHGCFWHQHAGCQQASKPRSNSSYWTEKLHRNITRDAQHKRKLTEAGYQVVTLWECEIERDVGSAVVAVKEALLKR